MILSHFPEFGEGIVTLLTVLVLSMVEWTEKTSAHRHIKGHIRGEDHVSGSIKVTCRLSQKAPWLVKVN